MGVSKFLVSGQKPLSGTIKVAGHKNAALKLIPAALLCDTPTTLTNVPKIRDIDVMLQIIEKLGAKVTRQGEDKVIIDPSGMNSHELDPDLSARIRASVVLAAPLLVRFGKACVTPPGGDQIGERLLTTHFSMMENFGVKIERENGQYFLSWPKREANDLFLEEASTTATEMALMLCSGITSTVKIEDAACEPHVKDLADFLSKAGVEIKGAGTSSIEIKGKKNLKGGTHKVIPDYIEGGTFIVAAAITKGHITIEDFVPEHYRMALKYFKDMGVKFKIHKDNKLEVFPSELVAKKRKFQTRPWPGFPTDLMSPFIVLATQTKGTVLCHDWMYEWRMFFVDDLISMGANIFIADPHRVIISGPTPLMADRLYSKDIRAGMSVILAALAAKGESVIDNIEMVERGYENLDERLKKLGADIKRIDSDDETS